MLEIFKDIHLNKAAAIALYIQLYEKLKEMIRKGVLLPDLRLPSIRQLADVLEVNQVTIVNAFKRLENEGFVCSRPGSGTYVANSLPSSGTERRAGSGPILDELYQQDDDIPVVSRQIKIGENTVNFASATPTPELFPVEDFKIVLNEVLERDKGNAFGYQDSQGYFPIRESIAQILKNQGIHCSQENIQVISGAQQGIDIISKAFLKQGDCVITESPTYTGAIAVFKSRDARVIDIEMHEDGPDLDVVEYNLKKHNPRLIYSIPSFQNPTGYSYSPAKREQILTLAERYNAFIIEDDYVSDLDFDQRNYRPLKSLDKNGRVIFIKSFSKIFMPGLRLGFMIVPSGLQGNILEAKHTTDISTSGLIQRAFDLYIRKGFWDKHFSFMYGIYKERYLETISALDEHLSGSATYIKPGGGLNVWLGLPYGFPVDNLVNRAAAEDLVFAPGRIFYSSSALQKLNSIRLSFASVHLEQIRPGIEKLAELVGLQLQKQSYSHLPLL